MDRSTGHILLVDDNKAIRKLLASHFEELNYQVTEAACAEDAKKTLVEFNFKFDLVLSDISMPGESGFDLLVWIKKSATKPEDLPVLLMTGVLPDAENRLKGLALGAVDYVVRPDEITELVVRSIKAIDHYKRVRSLERSLEDSQDLAMVGRILAASNHEVKNIATLVNLSGASAANILSGAYSPPPEVREQIAENLQLSTALLIDVVKSFRTFMSDGHSKTNKTVDLNKLITESLSLLSFRTKNCLVTWKEYDAEAKVLVNGQATRIKQVFINLVLNALEAISELNPESGGRIDVQIEDEGAFWVVKIKDNGIGFSAEEKTVFTAFDTTKKLKGGQGLGLWLSSMLAESMGGQLTLSSLGPSKGATGSLKLAKSPPGADDFEIDLEQYFLK